MAISKSVKRKLKYSLIRTGLEAVSLTRAHAILPSMGGRGAIFTLHHVRPNPGHAFAPNALLSVTPQFLEEAIQTAIGHGLTPVRLHELPRLLSDPSDNRRFVAFTLDDGYRNNAEFAAPVFRKYDVPYTIFITAGFVERTRTIWWETVEAMLRTSSEFSFDFGSGEETANSQAVAEKSTLFERLAGYVRKEDEDLAVERIDIAARAVGLDPVSMVADLVMDAAELRGLAASDPLVDFGAHTLTHVNLRRVEADRLEREIDESSKALLTYVGRPPRSFSYPYGWASAVGRREVEATARAGFDVAVTTSPGVLDDKSIATATALPRISLNGYYQKSRYVKALLSGIPFKLMK